MSTKLTIAYSELFNPDDGFEKLKKEYKELGEYVQATVKEIKAAYSGMDVSDSGKLKELQVEIAGVKKANESYTSGIRELQRVQEQMNNLRKQEAASIKVSTQEQMKQNGVLATVKKTIADTLGGTKDAVVENIRLKTALGNVNEQLKAAQKEYKANLNEELASEIQQLTAKQVQYRTALAESNNLLKNQIGIQNSAEGSVEQMRRQLSLLTIAWKNSTPEARASIDEQKLALTELIKETEAATGDNRRNVGNYKEALKELIVEQRREQERLAQLLQAYKAEQATLQKGTVEYRVYEREIRNTEKELEQLTNELNEVKSSVLDLSKGFKGAIDILGAFGVALGAVSIARNAFDILVRFDEAVADIQKTTGLTRDEVRQLSVDLLEIDTRTPINELQGLAAAAGRLSITGTRDIKNFVEAADKLFVALGDDLGGTAEEIATNLGKIVGVFGEEKEFGIDKALLRAGSAINALAANSKAAAGPILEFTSRVQGLAGVLTQQDAMALGAFFDEQGQSIEVAASTINVLLPKLATDYKRFAEVAGMTAEEFKEIAENAPIEALKAVALGARNGAKGVFNLENILKSFGIESARATAIVGSLTNNVERLGELQVLSYEETEKATSVLEEFETKNITLGAAVEKLAGAWEAYVISLDSSGSATNILAQAISFLARNLSTIIGIVMRVVAAFTLYKTILGGLRLVDRIKEQIAYNKALAQGSVSAEGASKSVKSFGNALKTIGFTAIIGLAVELAMAFYDIASGAAKARLEKQKLQGAMDAFGNRVSVVTGAASKQTNKMINEYRRALERGEITQEQFIEMSNNVIKAANNALSGEVNTMDRYIAEYKDAIKTLETDFKQYNNFLRRDADITNDKIIQDFAKRFGLTGEKFLLRGQSFTYENVLAELEAKIKAAEQAIKDYNNAIDENNEILKDNETEIVKTTKKTDDNTKSKKANTTELKANRTELEILIEFLREEAKLRKEIADIQRERVGNDLERQIVEELERLQNSLSKFGVGDTSELERLLAQQNKLRKEALSESYKFQISEIERQIEDERKLRIQALENERDELLKQENLTPNERAKIWLSFGERMKELDAEITKQYELGELEKTVAFENYLKEREQLELEYQDRLNEIGEQNSQSRLAFYTTLNENGKINNDLAVSMLEETMEKQEKVIEKSFGKRKVIEINAMKELYQQRYEMWVRQIIREYDFLISQVEKGSAEEQRLIAEKNLKLYGLEKDYNKSISELDEQALKAKEEQFKKSFENVSKIIDKIFSTLEDRLKRSIENQQKLLEKQNTAVEHQRALAEKGLENTYIYELQLQEKREKELAQAQKRLENLEKAKAFYAAFSANVSSSKNSGEALAKTIADFAKLEIAIRAISGLGFEKGGYTGDVGTKQVAGFVHGKEFVIDAATTSKLGLKGKDMNYFKNTFMQPKGLFDFNQLAFTSGLISGVNKGIGNSDVVNELKAVQEILKNNTSFDADALANGILKTTKKNGNYIKRNIYIKRK